MRRRNVLLANLNNSITSDGDLVGEAKNYFTIESYEDNNEISFTNGLTYSKNGGEWTTLTSGTTVTANNGDEIAFKATLTPNSSSGIGTFMATKQFEAKGNIMSLLFGDDFEEQYSLSGKNYAFYNLFYNNSKIINANKLILPATTLATYCYGSMFQYCSSLTTAPELPSTTLAGNCCNGMFRNCTSLTTAPSILPATTLAGNCYSYMFYSCKSLTTAPELPATKLSNYCYYYMFSRCTSLTTAPELPATKLATYCYNSMFYGCSKLNYIKAMFTTTPSSSYTNYWLHEVSSTGTFVKNKNATWNVTGINGIPSGWTVQTA